jgi:CTP:molybdopterin cytidylyltransferase MocA
MAGCPDLLVAVFAAGASRRLGRAKQLVTLGGEPLLRRQCRCALAADVGPVVAVLGFSAEQYRAVIADLPVAVSVNETWDEGLASTLRCGIRAAQLQGTSLLVLACDQYRIVAEDLRALYERWSLAPARVCVSRSARYAGPPAILPAQYHDQLLRLRGDSGARSLLYQPPYATPQEIMNPRASFDLDSLADLRAAQAWVLRRAT